MSEDGIWVLAGTELVVGSVVDVEFTISSEIEPSLTGGGGRKSSRSELFRT
jgi:hypothetical protein